MTTHAQAALLDSLIGDEEVEACFSNDAELQALLRFEAALAGAEAEAGLIASEAASAIEKACEVFQPDWKALAIGLARDEVVVPEFVKQLRRAVGDRHGKFVHWGATSQDAIDTGLMLRLREVTRIFLERLEALGLVFEDLKERDGEIPLMAHTRMQRALPFHAADKVETWLAPVERLRKRLLDLLPDLLVVQLGGPVGTRAEFGDKGDAVATSLAMRLDLRPAPCWHSQRDRIGEFGAYLSLLSGTLGKLGQDVALMVQNEVGAMQLPSGGGSSAMAHKSNPVEAEVLVALARFNAGMLGTLHQALVHENERSGAAWTLEWMVLPRMTIAAAAGLRRAQSLMTGARFVASA